MIRMSEGKVVDFVDVEDIAEKASFCRCWKSKNVSLIGLISSHVSMIRIADRVFISLFQWPYCDGAHGAHNKATGDNLGPVVVKRKPKE